MATAEAAPARGARALPWVLAMVAAVLAFNSWVLDARHFFFADDWGWLWRAAFQPWRETIQWLPTSVYNDRPGGELLIRLMYAFAGLRAGPYNLVWLCLHSLNCVLFYALLARVMPPLRAALAAVLAGCWFSTLTAVYWVGAVFDLLAATWCLSALLAYLAACAALSARRRWGLAAAALAFHFFAIRTKELSLALVVVFAAWDLLLLRNVSWGARGRRLLPHALLTGLFLIVYGRLYSSASHSLDGSAYALSLSADSVLEGIGYYFAQAFYAFTPGSQVTNIGAGFAFAALVAAVSACSRVGIAAFLSAGATCAAVLLLSHQRHPLYLYVPHFFIAAALCAAFPRSRVASALLVALVALLIAWPAYTGFLRDARGFVLQKSAYSQSLFYDYADIMHAAAPPRVVHVAVAETYFDPFSWGAGGAIQIHHHDPTITADVVALPGLGGIDCRAPGVLCLREAQGRLRVVR